MDCGPVADGAGSSIATPRPARRATPRPRIPELRARQRRHLMRRRPSLAGAPSHARQAGDRQDASGRAQRRARSATPVGARRTPLTRARRPIRWHIHWPSRRGRRLSFTPTTESPDANPNPALLAVHGVRGLRWRCGQRAGLSRPADQADRAYDARLGIGRRRPAGGARGGAPGGGVLWDADAAFAPRGRISASPFLLVVGGHSGIASLAELLAAARADPGRISYASAGPAPNPHMLGEMLSLLSGTVLRHVPYRGPGPAQIDLLGGSVDMQFDTPSATLALIQAGKLRALAVTGSTRLAALPEVPTVGELGYPQLQLLGWTALYAPRAVPPAVLALLQETLQQTLLSPPVRAGLLAMGSQPDTLIGDELLQEQRKSRERWRQLAQDRGIALD